jgi:hypothetical protein
MNAEKRGAVLGRAAVLALGQIDSEPDYRLSATGYRSTL